MSKTDMPNNIGTSQSQLDKITLANIWAVAWSKRVLLVGIFVFGMVATFIYAKLMPETYATWASIMPPDQESGSGLSSILSSSGIGLNLGDLGGGGERSRQFVDILKSRTLCEDVAERCAVRDFHLFEELDDEQLIEALRSVYVYDINATGLVIVYSALKTPWLSDSTEKRNTADMAACLVNTAIEVLDSLNHAKNVTAARGTRQYIERYMAQTRSELDTLMDEMEEFRRKNKVLALEEQASAIVDNAVLIGTAIAEVQLKLDVARQQLSPGTPHIRELEQELMTLKDQYNRIQTGGLVEGDDFSIALNDIPSLSRQYFEFEREIKVREKIHAFLEAQRAQEAIQEERDIATVQVLDSALPPLRKAAPRVAIMTAFGGIIALMLGLTYVIGTAVRKGSKTQDVDFI